MFLATLLLSPLFSDHMVLQRNQANPLWGKDKPGQAVTLQVDRQHKGKAEKAVEKIEATTAADGTWKISCPALPTGGPYTLKLSGSSEQVINDVLVGEVWLASGQSNMEFKLPVSEGGEQAVADSEDNQLRMFTVAQTPSAVPLDTVTGAWQPAGPQTSQGFSAVAYHFAKELRRTQKVPIGILHSSWGGTRVEAWTSREALKAVYPVEAELATLAEQEKDLPRIREEFGAKVAAWEAANFPSDTSNEGEKAGWQKGADGDAGWTSLQMPQFWQQAGMKFNGCVWFRRSVEIPAAWAGRDLVLELGALDDFDITYFNGERVGATPRGTLLAYQLRRSYRIPASLVKAGRALLAVRVFDQFGDGGMAGPGPAMRIHPADTKGAASDAPLPLAGPWLCRVERSVPTVSGAVYATSPVPPGVLQAQNNPAYLFNGMIAPLAGYGLRGAIWYQGESNVGVAENYRARLTAMIRDWRGRWGGGDFDFLLVQLANYKASPDWPALREAQTQVLAEPATGMAVTIDIGNPTDIHPRNKAEVGRRLALVARAQTYGERKLEFRGPVLTRVHIAGGQARVSFTHAQGLRVRAGAAAVTGFELAGADGVYHAATARIDGETVVLSCPAVPEPRTVRHGWDSSPECTLENGAGLPAEPFRTDTAPVR